MFTQKDYLSDKCTYEEYYSQFVTDDIINLVTRQFGISELTESLARDENLNNIPLRVWHNLTYNLPGYVSAGLRNVGDYLTLAGGVCILKQAARIAVKRGK